MPNLFGANDRDIFTVTVVNPKTKGSITNPRSKARKLTQKISQKAVTAIMVMALFAIGLLGAIGSAAPAQANALTDGIKNTFCGTGMFNYEPENKAPALFNPTTGDENTSDATPYEKYGMAGLDFTVWLGPERQEGLDDGGEAGGKSIVAFTGGKGASDVGMIGDDVANAKSGEATQSFPGFYNSTQSCAPFMAIGTTTVSNTLFELTKSIVTFTNFIYETSYRAGSLILSEAKEPVTTVVNNLLDGMFFEFLTPIIMLGALWMAWVGLVKRSSTQAAQGALWMIGAAVAAVAIQSNPMYIPEKVSAITSSVSSTIMTYTISTTNDEDDTNMCKVAGPMNEDDSIEIGKKVKDNTDNSSAERRGIRQFQCTMWYNFAYTPWVIGEFGENPSSPDENGPLRKGWNEAVGGGEINGQKALTGVDSVAFNNAGTSVAPEGAQSWALYHLDNKVKVENGKGEKPNKEQRLEQQKSLINVALAQLHTEDYNSAYKGEDSGSRLSMVTLSVVASAAAGIFIVVLGISIIVLDVGLIIMMLAAPIVLLFGVHPGFGRKVAMSWVEQLVGMAINRIILSFFLGIIVALYSVVFNMSLGGTNWLFLLVMIIVVTVAGFKYKNLVLGWFKKVNLGGDGGYAVGNGSDKAAGQAGNVAKKAGSAAIGAAIGMATGGGFGKVGSKKADMAAAHGAASTAGAGRRVAPKAKTGTPTGPTPNDAPTTRSEKRSAGGGSKDRVVNPVSEKEQSSVGGRPRETEPVSAPVETASIPAPTPAAPVTSAPVAPVELSRKEMNQNLKDAGYRSHVGAGTVAKAALRGAVVGTVTGKPIAGAMAGIGVISKEKAVIKERNAAAVSTVAERLRPKEQPVESSKDKAKPAGLPAPAKSTTAPAQKAPESKPKQSSQTPVPRNEGAPKKPAQTLPSKPNQSSQTPVPRNEGAPKKPAQTLPSKPKQAPASGQPNTGRTAPRTAAPPQDPKRSSGSLPTPKPRNNN